MHSQTQAAKHANASAVARLFQVIEVRGEPPIAETEVRRQAAERITLALTQTPHFRHDAVVGAWRIEAAPDGDILAAKRNRNVPWERAMELEAERTILQ